MPVEVYVGWDARETEAYEVCRGSLLARASLPVTLRPIKLSDLRARGLYWRPTDVRDGRLWDAISDAPMSTEFAISRFFAPLLAKSTASSIADWVMFCDCDFLWLADVQQLFAQLDASKAVACVQHSYVPNETVKMDGQLQLLYQRKNWSSLMVINLRHSANDWLNVENLNRVPGRDLHRFCWLRDDQMQALDFRWNWLEGTYRPSETPPYAVHFTRGGPWMESWAEGRALSK